jgi:hypothetical protein
MGLTISNLTRRSIGDEWEIRANAVFNAVYATDGVAITPEALGLMSISHLEGKPKLGYIFEWVPATQKLKVYKSGAVAAHTHDVKVIGGITADEDLGVLASGPTLGKLAATNRTVAGVDSATKGGVVASGAIAQAALAEVTNGDTLSSTPGTFVIVARGLGW